MWPLYASKSHRAASSSQLWTRISWPPISSTFKLARFLYYTVLPDTTSFSVYDLFTVAAVRAGAGE